MGAPHLASLLKKDVGDTHLANFWHFEAIAGACWLDHLKSQCGTTAVTVGPPIVGRRMSIGAHHDRCRSASCPYRAFNESSEFLPVFAGKGAVFFRSDLSDLVPQSIFLAQLAHVLRIPRRVVAALREVEEEVGRGI